MAVDIDLGACSSSWTLDLGEPRLFLDYDGHYCFLHPLWERLGSETGQYIDLYGHASFMGEALVALGRYVAEAQLLEHRKMYCEVRKQALLGRLAAVVARARQLRRSVACIGD